MAQVGDSGITFELGGVEFTLMPRGLGRYRYCIAHPYGVVGITPSAHLPAVRIQPRAQFLHAVGPNQAVSYFADIVENEVGPLLLTVSRVDLFADFQGWELSGDNRARFLCRGSERGTYEDGETFSGFTFGKRVTGTISGRLYDKTLEIKKKGTDYWYEVWGEEFDRSQRVLRVEFEILRGALREYGIRDPEVVIAAAGALWASVTEQWLTYRTPTKDATRSRWPIAWEWRCVQRSALRDEWAGLDRVTAGRRSGALRLLLPRLVGELASFGAHVEASSIDETLARLRVVVAADAKERGTSFKARLARKRKDFTGGEKV